MDASSKLVFLNLQYERAKKSQLVLPRFYATSHLGTGLSERVILFTVTGSCRLRLGCDSSRGRLLLAARPARA